MLTKCEHENQIWAKKSYFHLNQLDKAQPVLSDTVTDNVTETGTDYVTRKYNEKVLIENMFQILENYKSV